MNPSDMISKLMSGELVVVVQTEPTAPTPAKPKLVAEEQELADSLVAIAKKYGKFNEDETGIWAGYESAKDNVVAHIGVKCSNCALYEGNGVCKIIAQKVEDGGKCRFAVIPDGVVGGVYDPAKTPVIPSSSRKRKIKVKAETSSCPKATRDIATNLKNRARAIKTAMYGPLNPAEPNDAYYKKLGSEWDVSADQARKQTCGNCAMFIVTPEMKSCIENGVTGPKGKDEWEAIDAAGHLGYCEAFDFKCASKRTCRAWVTGGPITETKSVSVRPSVKALGATIGGNASTADAADMIDRDGDGTIFDGTPDEQPVKRKPKAEQSGSGQPYQRLDNSFLEQRRRRHVNRSLREQGITPTQGNQIQEMEDGSLQLYGRSDEERAARGEARESFTVEEDRKRFVNNQLRKRGIKPAEGSITVDPQTGGKYWNAPNRSDEERQARREARAEYDRRMRAGEPKKPSSGTPTQDQTYPPGYVPGLPADRYPVPKPDTSWQDNEDRRNAAKRPVGRPVDRLPGAQPGYPNTGSSNNRTNPTGKPADRYGEPQKYYASDNPQFREYQNQAGRIQLQQMEDAKRRAAHDAAKKKYADAEKARRERKQKRRDETTPGPRGALERFLRPQYGVSATPKETRSSNRNAGRNPSSISRVSSRLGDDDDRRDRGFSQGPKGDRRDPGFSRGPRDWRAKPPFTNKPVPIPPGKPGDRPRPTPATVNPREIPGRDVQKNPPSRMQPRTRTPNPNWRNPDSDRDRKPRTGRSFNLERGNNN